MAIEAVLEFGRVARQEPRPDHVMEPVHRALHSPHRGVHLHHSRGLAAVRTATGHGGLEPAANRLDPAEEGQPVQVYGGPRLEVLPTQRSSSTLRKPSTGLIRSTTGCCVSPVTCAAVTRGVLLSDLRPRLPPGYSPPK